MTDKYQGKSKATLVYRALKGKVLSKRRSMKSEWELGCIHISSASHEGFDLSVFYVDYGLHNTRYSLKNYFLKSVIIFFVLLKANFLVCIPYTPRVDG